MESSATGEHAKATEGSFQPPLMLEKAGRDHTIAENMIKPAAKTMINIMLGEKAFKSIKKIILCLITQTPHNNYDSGC
jgi:hypothetical protein